MQDLILFRLLAYIKEELLVVLGHIIIRSGITEFNR